jgi:uncharacterized DUF497 family protein
MDTRVAGFEWDAGNLDHCLKHGVSRPEVEAIFAGTVNLLPDAGHSLNERRFRAVGRTLAGRAIFIVFTLRERGGHRYIRPVSARFMHQEEIDAYEKENPGF